MSDRDQLDADRAEIAKCNAKTVVGQFTIEPWAGGWMATAYQGGPGSSVCLFATDEAGVRRKVSEIYARGMVPMNAIPSSQYHAEALAYRVSQSLATQPRSPS